LRKFDNTVKDKASKFILLSGGGHELTHLNKEELNGITLIEIDNFLKKGEQEGLLSFKNDGHWNTLGHQRLAAYLAPKLAQIISSR